MARRKRVGRLMTETPYSPVISTERIESRHCLKCQALMVMARIAPARLGFVRKRLRAFSAIMWKKFFQRPIPADPAPSAGCWAA
jgi:hypothetical protein